MALQALDHYTVLTSDVKASVAFYEGVLGLKVGERPPFKFPGAWLYTGGQAVLHLVEREPEHDGPGTGRFDHVAFRCTDYPSHKARLGEHGIEFDERVVPRLEMKQIFLAGPEGVWVELNFRPEDQ